MTATNAPLYELQTVELPRTTRLPLFVRPYDPALVP
jgi:hypothetical protein